MYLKRLEIKGFKSFADNTEIFLNPGINIIVGPNGCGKSNIVDAVRWALGEINVRHLRGQKGEDVIFHGSDRKKSQGMAFVELTLDNSRKTLPLDFTEITLTRKVFRDGESEFYLNRTRVRMKDIAALFTGTGLGKKGYSIISQGELEQVLSSQGLDRRLMLEEASGIIRYRQQRDEVKQRIQTSANDILRLNDLLGELGQRKEELGRKAEKASVFKSLSSSLEELERKYLQGEIGGLRSRLEPQIEQCARERAFLQSMQQQMGEKELALRTQEEVLQESMMDYKRARDAKQEAESRLASLETEIRLAEERIYNCRERQESARADAEKYLEMLNNLSRDIDERLNDYEKENRNYMVRLRELQDLEQQILEGESEIDGVRRQLEEAKDLVFKKVQAESVLSNEVRKNEEALRRAGDHKEKLIAGSAEMLEKIRIINQDLNRVKDEKLLLDDELLELNTRLAEMEGRRQIMEDSVRSLNEEYRQMSEELSRWQSRLTIIGEMDRDLVGYSPAARQIIQAGLNGQLKGILGLMGEIIKVPPGLEVAVETAAGKGLENIVVSGVDQARAAIEWLKQKRLGRITLLPLDLLRVQRVPEAVQRAFSGQKGVLGLASELVSHDRSFEKAVEYMLGRVLIVEDLDDAVRLFKGIKFPLRIVSLEGEAINLAGAISGGTRSTQSNSPLQRKGEEIKLRSQVEEIEKKRDRNRKECSRLEGELKEIDQTILAVRGRCVESRLNNEMMSKQIDSLEGQKRHLEQEHIKVLKNIGDLDNEIVLLENTLAQTQEEAQRYHEESQGMSGMMEELREKMETMQRDHEVKKERINSFREQLIMKQKEIETAQNNIDQFKKVKDSYRQSNQQALSLIAALNEESLREEAKKQQMAAELAESHSLLKIIGDELDILEEKDKSQRANLNRLRREAGSLRQNILEKEGALRELEMEIARGEAELDGLNRRWWEKFRSQPPAVIETLLQDEHLTEMESRLNEIREEIEILGPVDLDSIKEYEELMERYVFLHNQYNDLCSARDSLHELMRETEKLMEKDFARFFGLANESFNRTFLEIFGGGEAALHIDSRASRLEAGVEIEVKLPGKKTQGINLLSGGEKALTCIAFIFSLLRLKPVPFCILDEIDASLDDSNLIRFTEFVKNMSDEIQFIIITHRQATIEAGERIYGITMPENGISSVLTLNLKQAAELAG